MNRFTVAGVSHRGWDRRKVGVFIKVTVTDRSCSKVLNLITSEETLFPNEVTFSVRGQDLDIAFEGHNSVP